MSTRGLEQDARDAAGRLDPQSVTWVRAWPETVTIPTYACAPPTPHPMFLEKRVYQGSSGKVYPFPVIESVADEQHPQSYEAVILENEFLKIMILPELGGRVQMALDKTNGYHFIYYNRVIKPALVGLAGPWISGGIEFNWPQHHRPSTFQSVDWEIVDNGDGSQTVWCHDIDRMEGTEASHGLTLHPGRAYLEVRVRLFNRTPLPQTFLWWANPAVHVDEHHQSVFPPDVRAVMDHGKRAVSSFPIATGEYYKVDYAPGTDISRYRNIPVPTSYMAYHSDYDFVGTYDHGRQAGFLHVANHHLVPGKKQWTWGNGDFGHRWDQHLTDDDGPYVELMCGAFTDNQPDFSWLMPGEEKTFSQFFMPYKGVGVVKNATVDAAVGLEVEGGKAVVRVYAAGRFPSARVVLRRGAEILLDEYRDLSPWQSLELTSQINSNSNASDQGMHVAVYDQNSRPLVSYTAQEFGGAVPSPARALEAPKTIDTNESLYLAGMHLEQYRHATRDPAAYFAEALRRDPGDHRCHNALGRLRYRQGLFAAARQHFQAAAASITRHNANPYDGEPFYNLGLTLVALEEWTAARDAFYKATWNASCRAAADFELARLAIREGNWNEARQLLVSCLERNACHVQAVHLLTCALVQLGRQREAEEVAQREAERNPFNFGVLFELVHWSTLEEAVFERRMRGCSLNYLTLAHDYVAAGLDVRVRQVLEHYLRTVNDEPDTALVHYLLGELQARAGNDERAADQDRRAAALERQGFFPHGLLAMRTLENAVRRNSADHRAWNDLGNLYYNVRRYDDAIKAWEKARDLDATFRYPRRNLGIAYFNQRHDANAAWESLESAFRLNVRDARVLFELDHLAKRLNQDPFVRLRRLDQHSECVAGRDDLSLERVTLLNQLGRHDEALSALLERSFHPWEGGEGKVSAQYVLALTQLARGALGDGQYAMAIGYLERAGQWPLSLGEGKLAGIQENHIHYWLGIAHRGLNDGETADSWLERSARGPVGPSSPQFYNDQPPEMIFYQGLALHALGRDSEARVRFQELIDYGQSHLHDDIAIDFFAVSLPDFLVFDADLSTQHEVHCRFMLGLGLLGLGDRIAANEEFRKILALDCNHLGAIVHREFAVALGGLAG